MKILIIKGAFGDVYESAWQKSLTKIGHKVKIFDCHQYTLPTIFGRIERKFFTGPSIYKIRSESIKFAKEFKPDIILIYQGHYHDKEAIQELKKIAWVTGYHNDNPFSAKDDGKHYHRYKHFFDGLSEYNSFHVYRDSNILDMKQIGIDNVKTLMSYYIPESDYPFEIVDSNLGSDVIFAGHPAQDGRERIITQLVDDNFYFKLYGNNQYWKKILDNSTLEKLNRIQVLDFNDYRLALNSSKICLSFFSKNNRDTYTRRVFEIPAMKKFLMTTRTDTMQELYEEGKEAEYFDSYDELKEKVEFYLRNESARKKVEEAGYKRCISSGYDIDTRMQQWIKDIKEWRK